MGTERVMCRALSVSARLKNHLAQMSSQILICLGRDALQPPQLKVGHFGRELNLPGTSEN